MYNYKQLKLGKHGLPTWDGLLPVVMQEADKQEEWQSRDLVKATVNGLGLPDDLRNKKYENFPDSNIVEDRVSWALSDLALSGLLIRPRRGVYRITGLGRKFSARLKIITLELPQTYLSGFVKLNQVFLKT